MNPLWQEEACTGPGLIVYSSFGFNTIIQAGSQLAFFGAVIAEGLTMRPGIDMHIPVLQHPTERITGIWSQ